LVLLLPALLACARSDGPSSAHTVTDSAGIRIVESRAAAWGPNTAQLDTVPVTTIPAEDAGPYQFTVVFLGLLLPEGRIAVAEGATSEVRLFDAAGVHQGTIGRRGRGPGEFQMVSGLYRYRDDSLLAYDQGERRATVLPLAGGVPRVITNPVAGNLTAFGVNADGRVLLYNPGSYRHGRAAGLQWETTDIAVLDIRNGSGTVIGRLPSRELLVDQAGQNGELAPSHTAIWAGGADGFYWGRSDRFEVRHFDGEGQLRSILRRPVEPRAVTPAMHDRWVAASLEMYRRFRGAAEAERHRPALEAATRGSQVPLFLQAFVDHDQRLWVGESVWPEVNRLSNRWSIFAADGVWLGDLEVPPGWWVLDCRDDLVLVARHDEDDVPHVQVHRMVRPQSVRTDVTADAAAGERCRRRPDLPGAGRVAQLVPGSRPGSASSG